MECEQNGINRLAKLPRVEIDSRQVKLEKKVDYLNPNEEDLLIMKLYLNRKLTLEELGLLRKMKLRKFNLRLKYLLGESAKSDTKKFNLSAMLTRRINKFKRSNKFDYFAKPNDKTQIFRNEHTDNIACLSRDLHFPVSYDCALNAVDLSHNTDKVMCNKEFFSSSNIHTSQHCDKTILNRNHEV